MLLSLLIIDLGASGFLLWHRHLLNEWNREPSAIFANSPDAPYIYSSIQRADGAGLGFMIGFWVGSVIAMSVAIRCAPQRTLAWERVVAVLVATVPVVAIGVSGFGI
jgi:hypothetical protein